VKKTSAGIIFGIVNENPRDYLIEPSSWRDLKGLDGLEKICFGEDAWPLLELLGVLAFPGVVRLKAVVAGSMVGFIAGDPRRDQKTGWILTLGVLPNWRRHRIAEALLLECEQKMEMPLVKLTVRRGNEPAIRLYKKLGYTQIDIWSHYYHNGEDGLVLEKKLETSN
jgi:ribosomal protein S18 acetylase RimI-like enzyme